ncbi:hypothetical protein [Candidatus Methanocrinis natronophilus]|uniref:Uncharacterized protein n=1 Tax=Candidatus Methanocrinis natronophilus TaxID=3033396 RepID=A0ABT5X6H5_9EURY|nr:hypothetical protein [Candidatus Methanocrinis natronophilus]MDF0590299.1 hypothetical protein [Candidatus Methanocrinis natronophilus]
MPKICGIGGGSQLEGEKDFQAKPAAPPGAIEAPSMNWMKKIARGG